ncbi:glycosyltransferase family 4 protein [Streptomyces sp. NPDC054841]
MHVLVVHNRYASAQPSGENKVVDQEVALLRGAGHRVEVFERRSDDIAARSLLAKAAIPLLVPWNPSVPLAVSLSVNRRRWWSGVERFFCISAAQRDVLVRAGMPAERLAVKHNFVPDPGACRAGSGEHLLYLGRLAEAKGVRLLMAAWDEIAAGGGVGVPLVVAGAGPLEREVTAWAAGRDDVRYVGLYDPAQCRQAVARAVAVVAPSTWLEAFGLVVVEAMAAGVPVVAAGHGAFVELVEDGVTGLLHQPGEPASLASCIRRITAEPDRNQEMGQAARRRYEQGFSPAVGLERLVDEYRTAIAGRSAMARGGDTRASRGDGNSR